MKLTVITLEGTPEEVDASSVAQAILRGSLPPVSSGAVTGKTERRAGDFVPGVADEGQEAVLHQLGANPAAAEFLEFLATATRWPRVEVHGRKRKGTPVGAPLDYTSYLRLRAKGSQYGGFAYVQPDTGVVLLRLLKEASTLRASAPDAEALATGHREYRVRITIRDSETLHQAVELAREAYEATCP